MWSIGVGDDVKKQKMKIKESGESENECGK